MSRYMKNLEPISRSPNLIISKDCFVIIIDVQEYFMKGLTSDVFNEFMKKYIHLLRLCKLLNIPIIVTAEDIQKNGSISSVLMREVDEDTPIIDKFIYSCWGQENIQDAIKQTGRNVAVLCGLETDVCVGQTAIDLQSQNYRVVILTDMTYSRSETEHQIGLKRMEHHGIIQSLLKTWQEEITAGIRTKINFEIKENKLDNI